MIEKQVSLLEKILDQKKQILDRSKGKKDFMEGVLFGLVIAYKKLFPEDMIASSNILYENIPGIEYLEGLIKQKKGMIP